MNIEESNLMDGTRTEEYLFFLEMQEEERAEREYYYEHMEELNESGIYISDGEDYDDYDDLNFFLNYEFAYSDDELEILLKMKDKIVSCFRIKKLNPLMLELKPWLGLPPGCSNLPVMKNGGPMFKEAFRNWQ